MNEGPIQQFDKTSFRRSRISLETYYDETVYFGEATYTDT